MDPHPKRLLTKLITATSNSSNSSFPVSSSVLVLLPLLAATTVFMFVPYSAAFHVHPPPPPPCLEDQDPVLNTHKIISDDLQDGQDWTMVQKNGNQFILNSQPFYVNGFNTYWLMAFAADDSTRGKVTHLFHQASSVGLTVCRTWAFNDAQWRALQISPSVYDEQVFQALDFVISEAKKFNIRLILSLVNNWEAYGGKSQYVKWGKAAGLNLTSDDDFFSHPILKAYYKAHVKVPTYLPLNLLFNFRHQSLTFPNHVCQCDDFHLPVHPMNMNMNTNTNTNMHDEDGPQ